MHVHLALNEGNVRAVYDTRSLTVDEHLGKLPGGITLCNLSGGSGMQPLRLESVAELETVARLAELLADLIRVLPKEAA